MDGRQTPLLSSLYECGSTGLARILVCCLVLACVATQGISVHLLIGEFVRICHEEASEESSGEAGLREVSHKSARLRFAVPRRESAFQPGLRQTDVVIRTTRSPAQFVALYFVGAGINTRC